MRWLFSFLLLWLSTIVTALSSSGNRLLVVLEESSEKDKYSQFWGDLESRGFKIHFDSPKTAELSLFHLGNRAYDHVLLLPPKSKAYGPALTPALLLDFMKAKGNILVGLSGSSAVPSGLVSLLLELDIQLPADRNSIVVDHFNHDSSASEEHDILLVSPPKTLRSDVKSYFGSKSGTKIAVPRAVGQVLGASSPLLLPILRASGTSYSTNPKEETVDDLFASGEQISLVSAHQARNSARLTVLGSTELLQDAWFGEKYGNREFSKQVSAWTFKELGVLKVGRLQHHLNEPAEKGRFNETAYPGSQLNPTIYRIKNDVTYTIELSEYTYDHYTPLTVPTTDALQLEFSMLSPFHRLNLKPISQTANSTLFSTSFTLPDQHGIFNFRVNYKRPFLTVVDEKREVTVRHFAHDEWPRSWRISGAWVWIAGIWITVAGWVAFVAVWLWSEPAKKVGAKKLQ
ncbi:Dolichyl-diphosphooligosaccharide-protein glycosyltransferase 48kDa subunit [Tothia fuscella]|uniref:Dolichyl-diphosphooligosaccharide--protein glycosyltransferase subunit WBP1 n=1 Tax=Tothia fuscella TaxID=1048955 RepID=A0A9P4NU49_9PEZI|nr:Dolichyl-diphosphooligosaccharide-protein glycosyltransferase 48kDa subunit [Tothia fuscella]